MELLNRFRKPPVGDVGTPLALNRILNMKAFIFNSGLYHADSLPLKLRR